MLKSKSLAFDLFAVTRNAVQEDSSEQHLTLAFNDSKLEKTYTEATKVAMGYLDNALMSMVHQSAVEAKAVFSEDEAIESVHADLNIGGCDLQVLTTREYQVDGEGDIIQNFTSARVTTTIGSDIVEATAGIWE
jgi:hypothetical protein